MSNPTYFQWTISAEDSGKQLLSFLQQHFGSSYSGRFLKKHIEQRSCLINGRIQTFASTVLGRGDKVQLQMRELKSVPLKIEMSRILFEDDYLLVYNKPAGINCDLQGIVKLVQGHCPTCQLVHRLDRFTTGALIFAKKGEIFTHLVEQFKTQGVKKKYLAIVDKVVKNSQGKIEDYLIKKHVYAGQSIWGSTEENTKGLYACTFWKREQQGKNCSLLICYPKTGRTHQLRVHLSEMGHPILGDYQYSKEFICPYTPSRYLLHAEEISFLHPIKQESLLIHAPLPNDFLEAKKKLFSKG